jgi:hypothetical protein
VHHRIIVELLVHHDPHSDAVSAHHREEQGVALGEPLFANGDLL